MSRRTWNKCDFEKTWRKRMIELSEKKRKKREFGEKNLNWWQTTFSELRVRSSILFFYLARYAYSKKNVVGLFMSDSRYLFYRVFQNFIIIIIIITTVCVIYLGLEPKKKKLCEKARTRCMNTKGVQAAKSNLNKQYSNVGVIHTGQREVLITASVMHLL